MRRPQRHGRIEDVLIVLSGVSSAGKSTLAKAMCELSGSPLFHFEADRFLPVLPDNSPVWADEEFRRAVSLAMHRAIAAFASEGLDVVVDGSLPGDPALRNTCVELLRATAPCWLIGVETTVDALRIREAGRADRPPGWAESQTTVVHRDLPLDLVVDGTKDPASNAKAILDAVGLRSVTR